MNDVGSTGRKATLRLGCEPADVALAADILRRGGLVALPTETVYGLGADATNGSAVARIYEAKGRPRFNPLIVHVPTLEVAVRLGTFSQDALTLARRFWPGPLTLVVPLATGHGVSGLALAGHETIGIRIPAHPAALALLTATDRPIAAPSANLSGHVSPTRAEHVLADLDGRIDAVIDGGAAQVGLESTIIACLPGGITLLRPGGICEREIAAALRLQSDLQRAGGGTILAPGMMVSHYAPKARVRLDATEANAGDAVLLFGGPVVAGLDQAATVLDLSPSGDLVEAAANLFDYLRRLDATGAAAIAVAPIPRNGLGEAINDRLGRASAAT